MNEKRETSCHQPPSLRCVQKQLTESQGKTPLALSSNVSIRLAHSQLPNSVINKYGCTGRSQPHEDLGSQMKEVLQRLPSNNAS